MAEIDVEVGAADVQRIAEAIAVANGHNAPAEYAAKVLANWTALAPKQAPPAGS